MLQFLRFNELANLRCCDVKFCKDKYVELFIAKNKTDIYRNGNVMLAKTGHITWPYNLLNRYIQAAGIDFSSNLMLFRSLHFVKSNAPYTLRSTGISYTHAFSQLGYSIRYAASIVLDQGALPPLRMRVLMISYLSAMDVGVQTKPGTVTLKII